MMQKTPTVLVDLNLQSGDLELMLGLKPKFSLADVVENRERLDDALLASYITPHSKNLSLLAAPLKAESAEDIEPRHIYEIMELLRQQFDNVIIDTPHSFDSVTISALDHADQILGGTHARDSCDSQHPSSAGNFRSARILAQKRSD